MKFDLPADQAKKAKIPHEIFLTNLIGNHILWFIASLGLFRSYWQPLALVPVFSFLTLGYILWRAQRGKTQDPWFVMCHWQICAKRSRLFVYMLLLLCLISALGWVGHTYLGMMEVAVYALIGGAGILPVLVTVLALILMESDILHQAGELKLPDSMIEQYPDNAPTPVVESAQQAG